MNWYTVLMICKNCNQSFEIFEEDKIFYKTFEVPEPKTCPQCRLIRRFCERNTRNLYKIKCSFSGKEIISQYDGSQSFPVYGPEIWWSDQWDALKYGMEFDFKKTFFEQFEELKNCVPHIALFVISGTMENSEFNNCVGYLKNCYLIAESDYDEDCYYSNLLKHCKNMVDCTICYNSEICYECIDCESCYNLKYSQDCQNCQDSLFLNDCKSCTDCIGCINQRHQKFMIFNEQYTEEKYKALKKRLLDEGIEVLKQKCEEFFQAQIHKNLREENNENSLGDHLSHSKNAFYCFDSKDLEDCRYCTKLSLGVKSSMDYNSWGDKAELIYQSSSCGDNIYNLKFCSTCTTNVSNAEYCFQCTGSSDMFGCVGLRRNRYCILNKQYSKEEYENLRARVIAFMKETGEYGEFFPIKFCPYAYNETMAIDHFPLTKEEVIAKGYRWKDFETTLPKGTGEDIQTCSECQRNFKLIPQELKFYEKMGLPIPTKCIQYRHAERMKHRNPLKLWTRMCSRCGKEIKTSYPSERAKKIYCKECYAVVMY